MTKHTASAALAALTLPDLLLARYFRADKIERITAVAVDPKTRDVQVTLDDGTIEKWKREDDWSPVID